MQKQSMIAKCFSLNEYATFKIAYSAKKNNTSAFEKKNISEKPSENKNNANTAAARFETSPAAMGRVLFIE
jgi:hypothetical protein